MSLAYLLPSGRLIRQTVGMNKKPIRKTAPYWYPGAFIVWKRRGELVELPVSDARQPIAATAW
jgi:hypothetical protein